MNASVQIERWRQYLPTVEAFLPGCGEDELRDRCGLLLMRDQAAATKASCAEEAYHLLEHVERTAGNHAFRPMSIEYLHRLRAELLKVVSAASGLELFARGQLTTPGEGENARG